MNIMANKSNKGSDNLLKRSKELLDESVDALDPDVKDKLYMARRKAITQHNNKIAKNNFSNLIPIVAAGLTATIILGVFLQTGLWQSENINLDADFELVSTLENIELYDDFEFLPVACRRRPSRRLKQCCL